MSSCIIDKLSLRTGVHARLGRAGVLVAAVALIGCAEDPPGPTRTVTRAELVPPEDGEFLPFYCDGVPAWDPVEDVSGGFDHRDIVGDENFPAVMYTMDVSFLYLRLRLDDDPLQSPGDLKAFAWGFEFDADGATNTYEFILHVNGIGTDTVTWQQNTDQSAMDDPSDPAEVVLQTYTPAVDYWHVKTADSNFNGDSDFFLTVGVPLADLEAAGISTSEPLIVWAGTSNSGHALDVDFSCHDGNSGIPTLSDLAPDPVIVDPGQDPDGDGLSTDLEIALGTDPNNPDTDGDGLDDGVEVNGDNPTDPLDPDSDGDGLDDGAEDANGNGSLDPGETDPNDWDTDDGGEPDGPEVDGGRNPLDPADDRPVTIQGSGGCSAAGPAAADPLLLFLLVGLLWIRRTVVRPVK